MPIHLGVPELFIVLVVVLFIFGPGRLVEFGSGLGHGIHELRRGLRDDEDKKKEIEVPSQAEAVENGKV